MLPRSATPRPVRRRDKGTRTRAEIVAAAERHFATRGFEATRLEDIATEVGIRRAAIFYYFRDKQELYAAVLDEIFGHWSAVLPPGGSVAERLEASLTAWIDYIAGRPNVARLILREAANAQPGMVSQFVRSGSATVSRTSRPNGGVPNRRRRSSSCSTNGVASPSATARIAGWSGR